MLVYSFLSLTRNLEKLRVRVKLDLVGSCSTLVAEELLSDPDFLIDEITGELLYGTILVDTINRSPEAGKITPRDENVLLSLEELLTNIDGEKLFNELQAAKFDISGLLNMEILEKDLKRLAGTAMSIAMSSVTMDMEELVHRVNFKEDLNKFCRQENCDVVVIMTLVNDDEGKPARQIAVYSENRIFRDQIADTLDNSDEVDLELDLITPPFEGISVFHQGNVKASRKKVMPILKSFLVGDKTPDDTNKDFISVHTVSMATNTLVVANQENPEVHFTLDSTEILSGENSFNDNNNSTDLDFLGENDVSDNLVSMVTEPTNNFENPKKIGFDPLATISSLDDDSPPKEISNDSIFGNSQNPFGEIANSGDVTRNPTKDLPVINSSTNLSSAHSSNIFDLGISDSELVDPFSSVDETVPQDNNEINPKDTKSKESVGNDLKDTQLTDRNLLGFEIQAEASENKNVTSNPFLNFVDTSNDIVSGSDVKFQLDEGDDSITYDSSIKEDNSTFSETSSMNPFSSGAFLEVDAFKSEHPLAYKSPSLIVEYDDKSQADDLADLEESELFDKIPTPEIEHSGESSPFVLSESGTPFESRSEHHSRTGSESGLGNPGTTVPPNSLMDQGFEDMDRRLPSFNNAEMVERINRKKASLDDLLSLEESAEGSVDVSVPYTPANSFRDSSMESLMQEKRLPDFPSDTEMLNKVKQKRDSLQANIDFSDSFVDQSNPFDPYSLQGGSIEENSSMKEPNVSSSANPFFQLDDNAANNNNVFENQSVGVPSLDQTDQSGSSDVFNLFGYTGRSNSTSLDNQVGSESGSQDLFDFSEFETQSAQSGQNLNPFAENPFNIDSSSISKEQTVTSNFNSNLSPFTNEIVDQSVLEAINNSANLEAADTLSESVAKEIIHDAIESFPNIKNAYVANNMLPHGDQGGNAFWAQQGSSDSGIGSTDSPQQVTRVKPATSQLNSEVSVETEYLPGMDPLHGSLNIVTSPASQTHTIETDADKEVVEGESFRKISEAIQPEHSIFLHKLKSNIQTDIPEQIRDMIINKNIITTAENIQTSTDVDRVISPEIDVTRVISLGDDGVISPENDVERVISLENDGVISPENDVERVISFGDDGVISPENNVVTSLIDKNNVALLNVTESEHFDSETKVQSQETDASLVDIDRGEISDHNNVPELSLMDSDSIDYVNDTVHEANVKNTTADLLGDILDVRQSEIGSGDTQELNEKVVPIVNDTDVITDNNMNMERAISPIVSCVSDCSISSDTSSSFQSTSESELITVKENSAKVTENQVESHLDDNEKSGNNVIFENDDLMEVNGESNQTEEMNCSKLADKLVNETLAQVLEEEKERIVKEREVTEKVNEDATDRVDVDLNNVDKTKADFLNNAGVDFNSLNKTDADFDTLGETNVNSDGSNNTNADNNNVDTDTIMNKSVDDWTRADKHYKSETSDIIAEPTPVLINSCMTESAQTFESVSPLETPLDEYAGGFYEINPDNENKTDNADVDIDDADSDLDDSCYDTNLGENETGFYDFTNTAEDDNDIDNESDDVNDAEFNKCNEKEDVMNVGMSAKSHIDIIKSSYENNAEKLNTAIDNDNMRFLTLDEEYSDNSVSPLETPETEYVKGFFDINADNLELAIAKTESLEVNRSMFESIYSDSSVSPVETPDEESVGGFYQLNSESGDNVASDVAKQPDLYAANTSESDVPRPPNDDTASTIEPNVAKQPVTDDIPEINIELVDTPVSSKDSFDSETESCFEERDDTEHETAIGETDNDNNLSKNRSVRFAESTKFREELIKSPEPVTTPESDIEGFYELDIEASGNPFSPIESPSEEMFTLNYDNRKLVSGNHGENRTLKDAEQEDTVSDKQKEDIDNDVEEIADNLVDKAFNEAISTLRDESNDSIRLSREMVKTIPEHSNNTSKGFEVDDAESDNGSAMEDENKEEMLKGPCEEKLVAVADKLVDEAMSSAIEVVSDMKQKSVVFGGQVIPESSGTFSDSSDSETSSTTTEGSYRIDHSSDLATPDRDLIPDEDADTGMNPTVEEYNSNMSGMVENFSEITPKDYFSNDDAMEYKSLANDAQSTAHDVEIAGDNEADYKETAHNVEYEDGTSYALHAADVEKLVKENEENVLIDAGKDLNDICNLDQDGTFLNDENKENRPIPVNTNVNKNAEMFVFDQPLVDIDENKVLPQDETIQPSADQPLNEENIQSLDEENGNLVEDYSQDHNLTTEYTEYDYDEDDTNTSRYDDDTNTSMDIKSPDGPSYYKYDSFELDDKDVSEKGDKNEKGKLLNRQGTIIPDIIISMDDTPSAFDETMRVRRLGNYKPEIIDLSHETEDEISEKEESCESDNASETSMDTQLPLTTEEHEHSNATSDIENENVVKDIDNETNIETDRSKGVLSKERKLNDGDYNVSSDSNKHKDDSNQPKTVDDGKDKVKYHNVKDIEGDKHSKRGQKSNKTYSAGSENANADLHSRDGKTQGDNEEYITRKEIFYTSAGKLSVSIDSVVDPRSDSESDVEHKKQDKAKVSEYL
ncbi:hypothetical protein ACF0H5_024475 [Mactra antiquata]